MPFTANAGVPYRLWIRARAENDAYTNDSVFVQFDHSVDQAGAAVYRTGTSSVAQVIDRGLQPTAGIRSRSTVPSTSCMRTMESSKAGEVIAALGPAIAPRSR